MESSVAPPQAPEGSAQDDDHDARLAAVREAAQRGTDDDLRRLVDALGDVDFRVRRDAARGLARAGERARFATPALVERLDDPSPIVRQSALLALTILATDDARAAIAERAEGTDDPERELWLAACADLVEPRCLPSFERLLTGTDAGLRAFAGRHLIPYGAAASAVFVRALEATNHADAEPDPGVWDDLRCRASLGLVQVVPADEHQLHIERWTRAATEARDAGARHCVDVVLARAGVEAAYERLRRGAGQIPPSQRAILLEAWEGWDGARATDLLVALVGTTDAAAWDDAATERLLRLGDAGAAAARRAFAETENARRYGLARVLLRTGDAADRARVERWLAGEPESPARTTLERLLDSSPLPSP